MNDRFSSFDLNSFGTGFAASTAATAGTSSQQQQQQQQQQHHQNLYHSINGTNIGPLMEGYDPSILLGSGGNHSASVSGQHQQHKLQLHNMLRNTSNHHQTLLPSTVGGGTSSTAAATTTTTAAAASVGYSMAPSSRILGGISSSISTTQGGTTTCGGMNANSTGPLNGNSTSTGTSNYGATLAGVGTYPDFDDFLVPLGQGKNTTRRQQQHQHQHQEQHHPPTLQQAQQSHQQRHHLRRSTASTTAGSSSSYIGGGATSAAMATLASSIQQQQQQEQQRSLTQYHHLASSSQQHTLAGDVDLSDLFAPPSYCGSSSSVTASAASLINYNSNIGNSRTSRSTGHNKKTIPPDESWLEELRVTVSGLSLEPLSGTEIVRRLNERTSEVSSRYLPCVDFLVECQQELRKGLAAATTQRFVHHMFRDTMTPRQFFTTYISNLPERFYRTNRRLMGSSNLDDAVKELQKLCANARAAEGQGSEVVKNTFLGGMKDGESWGLRKWLSKHGGALEICNDTECILNSCQKLDRSEQSTIKLAARLRPMAKAALDKLKGGVPPSYQEQSSAHPYLPFFHRLESALRGMTGFDPEDDDVICIDDDDEVEELKAQKKAVVPPPRPPRALKKNSPKKVAVAEDDGVGESGGSSSDGDGSSSDGGRREKRKAAFISKSSDDDDGNNDDGDSDSDIEVLDCKPFARASSTSSSNKPRSGNNSTDGSVNGMAMAAALTGDDSDYMKALLRTFEDDADEDDDVVNIDIDDLERKTNLFANSGTAYHLGVAVDHLVALFESNQQNQLRPQHIDESEAFWDETPRYADALRLLSSMIKAPDSASMFLERVNEVELVHDGKVPYGSIIKHPLCFRDIVSALIEDFNVDHSNVVQNTGTLPVASLSSWNMWHGSELLQAIDLIFLNALAYGKASDRSNKSTDRSKTNKLRKELWAGIKDVIDYYAASDVESRRRCTPTRRGESSGFVVHKGST